MAKNGEIRQDLQRFGFRDQKPYEFFIKLDIPFFDGHLHIEDFLDWEQILESLFGYMEIPTKIQVKYVVCRLKAREVA